MKRSLRHLSSCMLMLLVIMVAFHAEGDASQPTVVREAQWRGDELVSPLPRDPQTRAQALRRVRELNAQRGVGVREDAVPRRGPAVHPVNVTPRAVSPRVAAVSNSAPGLLTSFSGIPYNGAAPANPDIAAGPNHVLVTAGDEFAVYDKCGVWHDGGDINTYFPVPSNIQFSGGRVVYDDWDGRWVMSFVGNTFSGASFIYVFVTNSSNPLAGWYFYALTVSTATEYPDDVHIAIDPDILYFTFDRINLAGGFLADAGIWYVDKADVYANVAVSTFGFDGLSHLPDFVPAVGIRPSQLRSFDGNMYFVGCNIDGGNTLNLRTLLDPLGTPSLVNTVVTVPAYATPPNGRQADGTYIESGDARFTDVVYYSGHLYATRVFDSGGDAETYTELIDVATPAHVTSVTSNGAAGGALDVDESGAMTLLRSTHALGFYPSAAYTILGLQPFAVFDSGTLVSAQGAYQQGGFGNDAVPYQLADHLGAALDPTDRRTVWMHGVSSSNSPAGTWRSMIGAVSRFNESNLQVVVAPSALAGPPGGPFNGVSFTFTLTNAGNTTANWRVASAPAWLTAGASSGALTPGAFQDVTFVLNGAAYALPSGIHASSVTFENCTGTGASPAAVKLGIAEAVECSTPLFDMRASAVASGESAPYPDAGVFITAIGDVDVCAIGIDHRAANVAEDLTVAIYEADGDVRGSLVATTTTAIIDTGMVEHIVPIAAQLVACQDYEIFVTRSSSGVWNEWSGYSLPFDVASAIRARNGRQGGVPSPVLPGVSVYGSCGNCSSPGGVAFDIGKLSGPFPPPSTAGPGALAAGAYVQFAASEQVYGVGVRADIPGGQTVTASVYDASSGSRGALIATGAVASAGSGTQWHDVPLAFTSLIGDQYEIEVSCPVAQYDYWDDSPGLPYTSYGAITVTDGVVGGSSDAAQLIHLRVHMCNEVLTAVTDTRPPSPMRLLPSVPNPASGAVVFEYEVDQTMVADMAVYDARGRKVADVFKGRRLSPGAGAARLDASALPAGVYFVRMRTPTRTLVGKLVLVR